MFTKRFSQLLALTLVISGTGLISARARLDAANPLDQGPAPGIPGKGGMVVNPDPGPGIIAVDREVFLHDLPPIAEMISIKIGPHFELFPPDRPRDTVLELNEVPIAREIAEEVARHLEGIDIDVALIDDLSIMITDCLGIRVTAGKFSLHMPRPKVEVGPDGIDFEFVIDRVSLTAIKLQAKPRAFIFCEWGGLGEVSGTASDIRLHVHIKPKISLELCDVIDFGVFNIDFSIGGLNLKPLPSALDKALKKLIEFSVERALKLAVPGILRGALRTGISQFICGNGYLLYLAYMGIMGAGVELHRLPEAYIEELQPLFPNRDLNDVRFGYSPRQPRNNATTDCSKIYFNNSGYVERLRTASLASSGEWDWLLHELRHTEQCVEIGGRREYAEMWFSDLAFSVIVTAFTNPREFFGLIHDNMPMEEDADERAESLVVVRGWVKDDAGNLPEGAAVVAVPTGESMPGANIVGRSRTRLDTTAFPWDVGYELVLPRGTYDIIVQYPGAVIQPIPTPRKLPIVFFPPIRIQWSLIHTGLVVVPDANGDGFTDVVLLALDSSPNPVVVGGPDEPTFIRGDANSSGEVDISDALLTLVALFIGGEEFGCEKAADTNDDSVIDISDPIVSLGFLFLGTTPPAPPFPDPGQDPTADSLGCELSPGSAPQL